MKKVTLKYTPERDIENGIMVETGETSLTYIKIIAGQIEYMLPQQEMMRAYAYTPVEIEEDKPENE